MQTLNQNEKKNYDKYKEKKLLSERGNRNRKSYNSPFEKFARS